MVKVFVRVLARKLGRFADDRILTEVQRRFRSGKRCLDQCLVLNGVREVLKRLRTIHIWPSWILVRLMTVYEERDCGIRLGNMGNRGEVCKCMRRTIQWDGNEGSVEWREVKVVCGGKQV